MNDLYREAQHRWLKPAEVLYILQNHENYQITQEPPQCPPGEYFRLISVGKLQHLFCFRSIQNTSTLSHLGKTYRWILISF